MTVSLETAPAASTRAAPVWKHMASGRAVDLTHLTPSDIHWPDIVAHLSRISRFDGGTGSCLYTVAQHSCLAHDHAGEDETARLLALLHDAHEAFIGDITTPTVRILDLWSRVYGRDAVSPIVDRIKLRLDTVIFAAARINLTHAATHIPMVRTLDERLFATEVRDLCAESAPPGAWGDLATPLKSRIKPWGPDKAAEEFAARLGLYGLDGRGV